MRRVAASNALAVPRIRFTASGSVRSRLTPIAHRPASHKALIFPSVSPMPEVNISTAAPPSWAARTNCGKSSRVAGSPPVMAMKQTPNSMQLGDDIEPLVGRQVFGRASPLQAAMPTIGRTVGR